MDLVDPPHPGGPGGVLGAVRVALGDLARLVVPVQCPGCGRWDVPLCDACLAAVDGRVRRVELGAPRLDRLVGPAPLPVWAAAAYTGPVRGVVVGWKDRGRADLTAPVEGVVRRAAGELAPVLAAATAGESLAVVPVPTRRAARRRRGADLVGGLADAAADGLRAGGAPARTEPALAVARRGVDQVGLGARARGRNTSGATRPRRRPAPTGPLGWVLLVDDVLTTGGTLAAAADAVVAAGGVPLGALVLAATPPPGRRIAAFPHSVAED